MKFRNIAIGVVGVGVIFAGGVAAVAWQKGLSIRETVELGAGVIASKTSRHTITDRTAAILTKKPQLKGVAKSAGGKLRILVFKNERSVEVHAPGWKVPRFYPMTAFSGTLGPKLREGDGQIPEGVYGIEYLNPNSSFYLSLKVSYPNVSDRARAKVDKRVNLGGDIMLHGKAVTIGCVPVGDDAIEDIFYLAYAVGIRNVSVIIAPYDMRKGRKPELERSPLKWYPDLCREIDIALCGSAKLYGLDDTSKEGRVLK
jgi:murein L,D-transpeptidase YafK